MKIVIASGKGGTGKTTVAVNLALYLSTHKDKKVNLFDCDVEAPNGNLFINANFSEKSDVVVPRPLWNKDSCIACGKCVSVCQYNAISKVKDKILIFEELCHSCEACSYLCPQNALELKDNVIGKIELALDRKPFGFGHGILNIGESLAPTIIEKLKERFEKNSINIIDAPPGTTCPVVKAMEDTDFCILVTEPTAFGLNDLELAASLAEKLKVPTGIVINRSNNKDSIIENFAKKSMISVIGKIPFNRKYAESYSRGEVLINKFPELKGIFEDIYKSVVTTKKIPKCLKYSTELIKPTEPVFSQPPKGTAHQYKEMVIISGKGGTGKTTVTAALSELMENKVLADNDVDASNLYLLCKPKILQSNEFIGRKKYFIDQEKCNQCGKCEKLCHFHAISSKKSNGSTKYSILDLSCEGCGFCAQICNQSAILSKDDICGNWYISKTKQGFLSHARLGIGEENSGKLVSIVRDHAQKLAISHVKTYILNDGPPGTGCQVISSVTGADLVLVVTEPTLSGVHDMERALKLTKHFNIKTFILINKYDLNEEITDKVIDIASANHSAVIGKIPFDKNVNDALTKGISIITHGKGEAYHAILQFWEILKEKLLEL